MDGPNGYRVRRGNFSSSKGINSASKRGFGSGHPAIYQQPVVQFEVGAAWGMGKRIIPVIIGDTEIEGVQQVLEDVLAETDERCGSYYDSPPVESVAHSGSSDVMTAAELQRLNRLAVSCGLRRYADGRTRR